MLQSGEATTFTNKSPTSCKSAMLTIPKTFLGDIGDAKRKCGAGGAASLIAGMLRQSFNAYQSVTPGTVYQCIHKAGSVSVHWLHLHTFCPDGRVDNMPNKHSALCYHMSSTGEANQIASDMIHLV